MKSLVVFNLDGTLAPSKSSLDAEMAALLGRLLGIVKVAVISGGAWTQFEKQVLAFLPHDDRLKGLSLLPTCGTKFYLFDGDWRKLYSEDFSADDKKKIITALNQALDRSGFRADRHWGDLIEDRDSQITFSALGQEAPLAEKAKWDPDFAKRQKIEAILEPMIPEFSIRLGGATSIDVTRPGIDKAYGIKKLKEALGVPIADHDLCRRRDLSRRQRLSRQAGGRGVDPSPRPGGNQAGRRSDLRVPGEIVRAGARCFIGARDLLPGGIGIGVFQQRNGHRRALGPALWCQIENGSKDGSLNRRRSRSRHPTRVGVGFRCTAADSEWAPFQS